MFKLSCVIKTILPGMVLIAAAFVAGLQKDPFLGLMSFLCFFVIGVTVIIEGCRRSGKNTKG
jgi:hypothetical protein